MKQQRFAFCASLRRFRGNAGHGSHPPLRTVVRYLALTNLQGRGPKDPEVKRARADIMRTGVVPRFLGTQRNGRWNAPGRFYRDKYTGTVWQLILLAELEADGRDGRISAGTATSSPA